MGPRAKGSGKSVKIFAAGCFNRLHKAHVQMLQTARAMGDELVVVLSNDAHNKKPNAVAAKVRMERMQKLGLADKIIVGEPDSFAISLRREKPDILTLGYDQRLPDEETKKVVEELGIKVVVLPWFPGKDQTCAFE